MRRGLGISLIAALAAVLALPGLALAHDGAVVNATVRVFPFVVTLELDRSDIAVGEQFTLTADVRNLSANNLRKTVAVVTFDGTLAEVRGPLDKHYGVVASKRTKSVKWTFTALAPGTLRLSVVVEALDPDAEGTLASEQVTVVTIVEAPAAPSRPGKSGQQGQQVPAAVVTERRAARLGAFSYRANRPPP